MPADLVALALQRKLDATDDPDRIKAIKARLKARPAPVPLADDLEALTKADLLDLAEDHGLDVPSSAKKADIIDALEGT
jgi:hypothetical protein